MLRAIAITLLVIPLAMLLIVCLMAACVVEVLAGDWRKSP